MAAHNVNEAIRALKAGDKDRARRLLMGILKDDAENEDAWLVLSAAVEDAQRKRQCLETVLDINPENQVARRGLERLQPEAAQQAAAQQAAAQESVQEAVQRAEADPPAPPDAVVAAATEPQPAEPARESAETEEARPLPTFEQGEAEADVEGLWEAAQQAGAQQATEQQAGAQQAAAQQVAEEQTVQEAVQRAQAEAPAPPDAVVAAETPPSDSGAPTEAAAEAAAERRSQRWLAIAGIVVAALLLFIVGVWVVLYLFVL